jgi:hypothetical protein
LGLHSSGIGAAFLGSAQQNPNKVPTERLILLCLVLLASTDQLPDPVPRYTVSFVSSCPVIVRVAFRPVLRTGNDDSDPHPY